MSFLPFTGLGIGTSYWRADRPEPAAGNAPTTAVRPVTPNWFRTMGIPQLAGQGRRPPVTRSTLPRSR